jgi:NTP pyrophosphatase (non-canonical NTP hydrolase)
MTTIHQLTEAIVAFRDARDWKQFHTLKDMALSLMLESAEVAEHFQYKSEQQTIQTLPELRGDLGRELADVLYWVLLIANDAGIDLPKACADKLAENEAKYPVERSRGKNTKYDKL